MKKFCSTCGERLAAGGRCPACGEAEGPPSKVLVSCFVFQGESLLWMRRALPPRPGCWAIPAGFMEIGETLAEAAARELREETGVVLETAALRLYSLGSITDINEVYVAFRATVKDIAYQPGREALDVQFFSATELPWEEIAFPRANYSIRQAYADVQRGYFGVYLARHDRGELCDQLTKGTV